jgi:hypothetical protein
LSSSVKTRRNSSSRLASNRTWSDDDDADELLVLLDFFSTRSFRRRDAVSAVDDDDVVAVVVAVSLVATMVFKKVAQIQVKITGVEQDPEKCTKDRREKINIFIYLIRDRVAQFTVVRHGSTVSRQPRPFAQQII